MTVCATCLRASPWVPAEALPGSVFVDPDGEVLRLALDGHLDPYPRGPLPA